MVRNEPPRITFSSPERGPVGSTRDGSGIGPSSWHPGGCNFIYADGCGPKDHERVVVSGTVTFNGAPPENGLAIIDNAASANTLIFDLPHVACLLLWHPLPSLS